MKFMVAVDLEGLACVVGSPAKTLNESTNYIHACRQGIREANAAAKALFDMGATQVVVWDNHGAGTNLNYEDLDERCDIVLGCGAPHRWPGLDNTYAGVLLIGYHSMDNTPDAVLAHSFNSKMYQWMKINGVEVGEMEIDAAMAAETAQVPLIFVSSDDKGVAEAKKFFPWVETVITKTGFGKNIAISKHPKRAANEIYEGVKRAVEGIDRMKPFTFKTPIEFQVRYKTLDEAEKTHRDNPNKCERIDAYTVRRVVNRLSDIF